MIQSESRELDLRHMGSISLTAGKPFNLYVYFLCLEENTMVIIIGVWVFFNYQNIFNTLLPKALQIAEMQ